MKNLFLCLGVLCLMVSCQQSLNISQDPSTNAEIESKINQLYNSYDNTGENKDIYSHPIPPDLFSSELSQLLNKAIKITEADKKRIANSSSPKDKPALIETPVFSSLPEGFTTYKIKCIDIMKSIEPIVSVADVTLEFQNSNFPTEVAVYTDKVRLVNSLGKGWKVDNVTYDPSIGKHYKDAKTFLNDFILINAEGEK